MLPYFTERVRQPGEPAARVGWQAQEAVERGARPGRGADRRVGRRDRLHQRRDRIEQPGDQGRRAARCAIAAITWSRVATEHKSVLDSFKRLEREGWPLRCLGVGRDGLVDLDELADAMTDKTVLVSRDGGQQRDRRAAAARGDRADRACARRAAAHRRGAGGRQDSDRRRPRWGSICSRSPATSTTGRRAAARSTSGARSRRLKLECQIDGGGHENGLRSGTLNVPGIVGLGAAAAICRPEMPEESARLASLRDRLLDGLRRGLAEVRVNGSLERRLPHNLHVSFDGVEGEALLMALGDLAVSTGSACSSGSQAPSHVLAGDRRRRRPRRRVDPLRARPHDVERRRRFRRRARHDCCEEPQSESSRVASPQAVVQSAWSGSASKARSRSVTPASILPISPARASASAEQHRADQLVHARSAPPSASARARPSPEIPTRR